MTELTDIAYSTDGPIAWITFNRPKYRTTLQNYVAHMQELVTSKACPQIPTCSKGSTGLVGSARPCTAIDPATSNCIAN